MSGFRLFRTQIVGMFKKKMLQTLRNWLLVALQIALPVGFIIISVLSSRASARVQNLPSRPLTTNQFGHTVTVLQILPNIEVNSFEGRYIYNLLFL